MQRRLSEESVGVAIKDAGGVVVRHSNHGSSSNNNNSRDYHDNNSRDYHDNRGYVLTLKFTGQQVAGMRGMFSQQCWLRSFSLPMTIVEPFVLDSMLTHSSELWEEAAAAADAAKNRSTEAALRMTDILEVPSTVLDVASFESFLSSAPRRLIVVDVCNFGVKGCLHFDVKSCSNEGEGEQAVLEDMHCQPTHTMRKAMTYLETLGFEVVRSICLDCTAEGKLQQLSPGQATEWIFGGHRPEEVTVLFSHWKFSFQVTSDCSECAGFDEAFKSAHYPLMLHEAAARYMQVVDGLQRNTGKHIATTIAVMVRLEWFLITYRNKSLHKIHSCLRDVAAKAKELTSAVVNNNNNNNNEVGRNNSMTGKARVLLALDVGRFGSGSFDSTMRIHHITAPAFAQVLGEVKSLVLELYGGRLDFEGWEESFVTATGTRLAAEKGYVAALQSVAASKADCLLLMGGGHFQLLALQMRAAARQPSPPTPHSDCVHKICFW